MFDAKTAAAVKLEEPRRLSPAQEACGASCVWRRNYIVSSFSAHTRQKSNRQKQPPEKVARFEGRACSPVDGFQLRPKYEWLASSC
jgi:hypothetical protein